MSAAPITVYTNARAGPLVDNIRQVLAALPGYTSEVEVESQAKVLSSRLVSLSYPMHTDLVLTAAQHALRKMEGERAIIELVDAAVPILTPFADQSWSVWDRGMFVDAYAPSERRKALNAVAEARRALAADPEDPLLESDLEVALLALGRLSDEVRAVKDEESMVTAGFVGERAPLVASSSEFLPVLVHLHADCLI